MSFCLDTYLQQSDNYEIHASRAGFKDCAMIIRFKADEIIKQNDPRDGSSCPEGFRLYG